MLKLAKILLEGKANVNQSNKHGETPLQLAVQLERTEVAPLMRGYTLQALFFKSIFKVISCTSMGIHQVESQQ